MGIQNPSVIASGSEAIPKWGLMGVCQRHVGISKNFYWRSLRLCVKILKEHA